MIIVKTNAWQYLGFLLHILGSSQICKISVKTFEKNISENIVKLKLEQNIKSLLYNNLVYIYEKEQIFDSFII